MKCFYILALTIIGFLLASCQLIPKPGLLISPLQMPAHTVLIQGKIIKDGQIQALAALVESDREHLQVVILNPFGQRSRTLTSDAKGWTSHQHIPATHLIEDAELLTGLICVLAGPKHSLLRTGNWRGLDVVAVLNGASIYHKVSHQGDPWSGSSGYQKLINERVVFELQLQAAPF